MTKLRTTFFCTECGTETPRWQGQCPACRAWNTLVEEPVARSRRVGRHRTGQERANPIAAPVRLRDIEGAEAERWRSGIDELDYVLGGGVVPGSLVLVGGEPGIGKSTLLLQVAAALEAGGRRALYVSGEESSAQVRMRADRLGEGAAEVTFLGETELGAVLERTRELGPSALVMDSIQTVYTEELEGAPGSVTQVRECAARLQRLAKETGSAIFLVGHVTKGGAVAGPKTLEHIVDTVLYFEGSDGLDHRLLRATKNRFGSVDEIGVFRMGPHGLAPVANPSELFLGERAPDTSGTAVAAIIEGTRPLLVEVQALCTRTAYGAPQRATTGFDRARLALLLAVLEKRARLPFAGLDVFLNVVGGVHLGETAADLAVVAALCSGALDRRVVADSAFIGEIGLGGELRSVGQLERRIAEAARMGFRRVFVPSRTGADAGPQTVDLVPLRDVGELMERALG